MIDLNKNWKPEFGTIYTWFAMDKNGLIAVMVNNCWGDIPQSILKIPDAESLLDDIEGNPLTTFIANVGGNTTFAAGRLNNLGGSSFIDTKGNVALDAVNVGYQTNSIGDANNYYNQGASSDIGSSITGSGDIIIKAGNNVTGTATATQINSNTGDVGIVAGNDITFSEGRNTQNLSTATKSTDKGFLSKTTNQNRYDSQSDQAISSNIEGNQVAIQAGNNISLTGTNAISDKGTSLTAGSDISILAAQNTSSESTFSQTKKSGLFGADGGMGFTIGKQQTDETNAQTALTNTASNVAAIDGNRGNTVVRAKEINIDSIKDVYTNQSESKFKQTGLTVSVSNSLIDSARAIDDLADAAGNTQSVRMKGLASTAGLLKTKALAKQANSAGYDLLDGNLKGVGNTRIQATIGSQKSQSNSSSYTEVNQGSSITTNNLALIATDAGTDSNININGSNLDVTNNALFQADNDFNVSGVAQNSTTRSTNSSSSAAIGGYASTGSGVGITANASGAKGHANSDSTTYANSQINVGGTTTFDIGNDVNIKGGVINTNKAQGFIGGDVNIESLQDTATYDSNQKNMGFTADIDIVGGGAGSSLSVNGGKTDINADYKAVGEQSGIFANEADLVTEGKGSFIGGVFTTSAQAQANGKSNIVFKQGVTSQDINNTTSYDGDAFSAGVSIGDITDKPQANMNGLGYGTDSDSDSSITKGGVSGYNDPQGMLTTENREALGGKLDNNFNANAVLKDLNVQVEITKEFRKESFQAINDYTGTRQVDLLKQLETASDEQKTAIYNEIYKLQYQKRLLQTLVGVLAGLPEPAITQGSLQLAATKMRKESLDNSRQSPGVVYTDENGNSQVISNVSYDSGYFDGVKLGGTRLSTDVICGEGNLRCNIDASGNLIKDVNGNYTFKGDDKYENYQDLKDDKKEFKPQIGATGGAQAEQGTLFGFEYNPGGLIDMNIEGFAGTHDLLGGQLPGYYGNDGNTKPGDKPFQGVVTGAAIPVAAPFALADLLSPDMMVILLQLSGN